MKKFVAIVILAVVLIGFGTANKIDTQFPYQFDMEAGSAETAVRNHTFSQLNNNNIDTIAKTMHTNVVWTSNNANANSQLVTASGVANYNYERSIVPYTITFRVLNDGRAKIESSTLNHNTSSIDQIMSTMMGTADHVKRIEAGSSIKAITMDTNVSGT